MKKAVKVILYNFVFLSFLLLVPAFLYEGYARLRGLFSANGSSLIGSEHLGSNTSGLKPKELEEIKNTYRLTSNSSKDSLFRYLSYVGWREFKGSNQFRPDPHHPPVRSSLNSASSESVWFFGGSTMWGSGVNYLNTIPSHFSSKTGSKVLNLGETAWQSRQSLNELITLAGNGGYPDKVIFYDGVNDVAIGCRADLKYVPSHGRETGLDELIASQNIHQFIRFVSSFSSFISAPYKAVGNKFGLFLGDNPSDASVQAKSFMDCSSNPAKATRIANHLVNNWYVAYLVAKSKGAKFYGVLQPHVYVNGVRKEYLNLTPSSHLQPEFDAVYPLIRQRVKQLCMVNGDFCRSFADGSSWLIGDKPVFVDFCHLTGRGNQVIAQKLAELN